MTWPPAGARREHASAGGQGVSPFHVKRLVEEDPR